MTQNDFFRSLSEAPFIPVYTFTYDSENHKLDMVYIANSRCMTKHTDTPAQLVKWYDNILREYYTQEQRAYEELGKFATYYKLAYSDYITLLFYTLRDLEETNPEYYV